MPTKFGPIMRIRLHTPDAQRILMVVDIIVNIYKTAQLIEVLKSRALSPSDGLQIQKT